MLVILLGHGHLVENSALFRLLLLLDEFFNLLFSGSSIFSCFFFFFQEELYDLILETNKECIKLCKPGTTIRQLNTYSVNINVS